MKHPTTGSAESGLFHEQGYLVVENAVPPALVDAMASQFATWVAESRDHIAPWGETINAKPRFDLEGGHSAATPALRRVNAPVEVSDVYFKVMSEGRIPELLGHTIGPDVRFHHSKINSKLPGSATQVKWHQDFAFTPHSNDDLVTVLIFIDDVTLENGPLKVVPGSHRGELHSLWRDGVFTGAVTDEVAAWCEENSVTCTGPAGSACLMHTRLLHGSSANASSRPRTLFICVYSADDAVPLSPNPMPSRFEGLMVAGRPRGTVRSIPFDMPLPQVPDSASFFDQQAKKVG